ncbi:MAG TPA: prephenate dehydrogenase [Candidatus Hydrogenedens sp.]|nr:prephenate dehydrogenase [Candidatus Hydrogenedens sp.]HOL19657.1 prephenate dehydrogenase [Candidatus Hydrogenedens sp.]HPP57723.1 prephenate dehydrogenase [Candidatus Hydrogenedens sp.]
MTLHLGKTVIIGVGLLGASLGMAIRKKKLADLVIGIGRNQSTLETALQKEAIDTYSMDLSSTIKTADFIIICTPVQSAIDYLKKMANYVSSDVTITDVCSTKKEICGTAQTLWQKDSPFIGSHPLAGSEKYGPEFARHDFYENTICLIEKGEATRNKSKNLVHQFWKTLGTKIIEIDAEEHDYFMAYTSHLPHVIASALAQVVEQSGAQRHFIGGGFRDTTRIAGSRPEIWNDIIITNKTNMITAIKSIEEKIKSFIDALEKDDIEKILQFFQDGNDARKRLLEP